MQWSTTEEVIEFAFNTLPQCSQARIEQIPEPTDVVWLIGAAYLVV
jgi:hypothetical protein